MIGIKLNKLRLFQAIVYTSGMIFVITSSGCGGMQRAAQNQSFLKKINLKSYSDDKGDWVEVQAQISSGKFALAGLSFPIIDPKTSKMYGKLSIAPNIANLKSLSQKGLAQPNTGTLTVSLSITEITQAQGVQALLPNGTELPIGGLEDSKVLALLAISPEAMKEKEAEALASGNQEDPHVGIAKIYYAFSEGVALLGVAIPFSALDSAGQYAPGTTVFTPLQFGLITVSAGMFAGGTAHTTGLGLFVDLSSLINSTAEQTELKPENTLSGGETKKEPESAPQAPVSGSSIKPEGPASPLEPKTPQDDPSSAQIGKMNFAPVIPPVGPLIRLYQEFERLSSQGLTLE